MGYWEKFRVPTGKKIKLKEIDPDFTGHYKTREGVKEETARYKEKLHDLQNLLYAGQQYSLLICLQGMDGAGKDGLISHFASAMNPQGCRITSFKEPTNEELAHDFLWRIHKVAPARREVAIFNRSHYEDVLVVRVHNLVSEKIWSARHEQINSFEQMLAENNTHILKFFLHISKKEQLKRFKDRLDDPLKQWKISESDYKERDYWGDYTKAYNDAISLCNTEYAPWFVIPSNHKWFRDLAVLSIVVEKLERMRLKMPAPSVDLKKIRREYHKA